MYDGSDQARVSGNQRVAAQLFRSFLRRFFHIAQTCGLAAQTTQIEKTRATHLRGAHHIDLVDHLGVNREDALDALPEADLANSEAGLRSVVALDDDALESLQAFLVPFFNLHMDADGVSRAKRGNVVALCFRQQLFND